MAGTRLKRLAIGAAIAAALLSLAAVAGLHFLAKALQSKIEAALGPDSHVESISVGLSSVEIRGLRIKGPKGWPAPDTLRADSITVTPDLKSLLSADIRLASIRVDGAYLSVLRTRDKRLRLLPALLDGKSRSGRRAGGDAANDASNAPPVEIGAVTLENGTIDFFDATVRQPAYRTRLEQLQARVEHIALPGLSGRTRISLDGTVRGVQRNGKLALSGWLEIPAKNSELAARLQGVDLVALQPYLIKASETGVRHGTLDLELASTVRKNRLHAPGTITLNGLELLPAQGMFGTFMGVPRQAVVAALKNRRDQIALHFTLEGDLDDPGFSLNEDILKRLGASIAESLGITIEGMVRKLFGN